MQNWSNLLWAWSTAGRASDVVFGLVIHRMIQQQSELSSRDANGDGMVGNGSSRPALKPQHWSNTVWAVANAQCYNGHEELLNFIARLFEDDPDFVRNFKSQELTNTVWAVATIISNMPQHQPGRKEDETVPGLEQPSASAILRYCLQEVLQRNAAGFSTQSLSNTVWAAAKVGFGLPTATTVTTTPKEPKLSPIQSVEDTNLMVQAINVIIIASMQQLPRFSSQELANLVWALARLLSNESNPKASTKIARENAEPLLRGIGLQLANPQREIVPQNVAIALWALATLNYCDESIYRAIATRIKPSESHLYKPQELSNSVWAFATAEVQVGDVDIFDSSLVPVLQHPTSSDDPVTICFAVAAQELMRRPQQFTEQAITNILRAFSKVGIRHPALFKFIAELLVGHVDGSYPSGLDEFSAQGLANLAWAYARQDQLAENTSGRLKLNSEKGELVAYRTIYVDVGEQLLHRLFVSIAEASLHVNDDLRLANPQHISITAWAFATLGLKETRYLEAAKDELSGRIDRYLAGERNSMTCFDGQELANLLWAMATLTVSPGKSLDSLVPYFRDFCSDQAGKVTAENISKLFKRQGLANMVWACAVFGKYPDDLMHFLYAGLFGPPGENDPDAMQAMYDDSGLQLQGIMTLVYAQAGTQLYGCCQNLSLPDNFPDAWLRSSLDGLLMEDQEVTLRTSKTQRDVAAAFSRIGFDHAIEYTISMADMAQSHGLRLPSSSMEVLSIDVADADEKIAIEIDGPYHYICRIDNNARTMESDAVSYSKKTNGKLEYQFRWTGEQQEVNGSTVLKERLLALLGWRVVHIPFWEWNALGKDAQAKDEYCANLLRNLNQCDLKDGPR